MKPMHILVDSLADDGLTNAQMINAREIVRRLNPERFRVTMFVHGSPEPEIRARPNTRLIQVPNRLQTIPLLAHFLFGRQDILFYLKASPASRWYMKLRSPRHRRCVVVGTVESQTNWRDETMTPQTIRLIEETILRCDYLFSNSAFVQRSLEMNYGLRSEVVPTGVDLEFFAPDFARPANPRPRILFVGSLRPFKGPQVVLDAAQRFPQADFVLVGSGVMDRELHDRARGLPNVILRGSLGRLAIRAEYRAADIFLFPSHWEGSPKVLMEAAASGLPIVARNDYEPESVIHGETGFLGATPEELIDHLAQVIENRQLSRTMGQAGRSHVAQFSWDVITRQWEEIFTRLAQRPGKGASLVKPAPATSDQSRDKTILVTRPVPSYRPWEPMA
jgi:glycosyltransferase involved in cell wall biosynthesis